MEEYTQLTLNDWLDMKNKLRQQLLNLKRGFVGIGYTLRRMEDTKAYEQEGYKSLSEFAKKEFGLEASTVSKFMAINRAYSLDGYSELLLPEFEDFNRSQLEEMLLLPDGDREMITPETKRADIRALKQFNKAEPAAGEADTIHQLVKAFFDMNSGLIKEVREVLGNLKAMKEVINPSGSRSFKKGLFFLLMHEEKVDVKKFGGTPETYSWQDFIDVMTDIYGLDLMEGQEEIEERTDADTGREASEIQQDTGDTGRDNDGNSEEVRRTESNSEEPRSVNGADTGDEDTEGEVSADSFSDDSGAISEDERGREAAVVEPAVVGNGVDRDVPEIPSDRQDLIPGTEPETRAEKEPKTEKGTGEGVAPAKVKETPVNTSKKNPQEEMTPPEHVEAEVVLEEVMKKTQMLYLLQRAEYFVKIAQWELAEEKVLELLKGIRSRKNGGYVQE